jgi:hypothetical protein
MTHRAAYATALLFVGAVRLGPIHAQDSDDLETLLERLGRYLLVYETELSAVVADEHYVQREFGYIRGRRLTSNNPTDVVRERRLESDVAFLRLPDRSTWFGVRDVKTVDRKPVASSPVRLVELMKQLGRVDIESDAAKIVVASAQHNLGTIRTINMPTTPLEVLHPDHHVQFIFKLRGRDRIDGVDTVKLGFEEFDVPTLIKGADEAPLFIVGTAWAEPASGRLWRVELVIRPPKEQRGFNMPDSTLRVDFMRHSELQMMVPKEMKEQFYVPRGRGYGEARYSNFRRFSTGARIVPQR